MDEKPLFFNMIPNKNIENKGNKSIIIKTKNQEKYRIQALFILLQMEINPFFLIFKEKQILK